MKNRWLALLHVFTCALFVICSSHLFAAETKVVVVPMAGDTVGNAVPGDVLRGKTFSSESGSGLSGTRPPAPVPKVFASDATIGVPWPDPRFTGNLLLGYIDKLTGLRWAIPGTTHGTFLQAFNHCDAMERGIPPHLLTDWRLPDLRELQSLIDYSQSEPALMDGHPFGTIHNDVYWSATQNVITATIDIWAIDLSDGKLVAKIVNDGAYAWCLRGGLNN